MEPRPSLGVAVTGDPGDPSDGIGKREPPFSDDEFPVENGVWGRHDLGGGQQFTLPGPAWKGVEGLSATGDRQAPGDRARGALQQPGRCPYPRHLEVRLVLGRRGVRDPEPLGDRRSVRREDADPAVCPGRAAVLGRHHFVVDPHAGPGTGIGQRRVPDFETPWTAGHPRLVERVHEGFLSPGRGGPVPCAHAVLGGALHDAGTGPFGQRRDGQ